jgi:hypothetical protein
MNAKEFINPTSMLTPGIAGALTTGLTMPLALAFDLKYKWVALSISLLISYLIVSNKEWEFSKLKSAAYWFINGLIIFSVSVGAGTNINPPPSTSANQVAPEIEEILKKLSAFDIIDSEKLGSSFWISNAYADSSNEEPVNHHTNQVAGGNNLNNGSEESDEELSRDEVKMLKQYFTNEKKQIDQQEQYNKRWSW